ncbi:MAG: murein transglycosylase A [Pseudomonadota bacterium]
MTLKEALVSIVLSVFLVGCGSSTSTQTDYSFKNDGRNLQAPYLSDVYTLDNFPRGVQAIRECDLNTAIARQRSYLYAKSSGYSKQVGNLRVTRDQMLQSLSEVERWARNPRAGLPRLNAYKISGKDQRGNVQFTGYFSPKINISSRRTLRYRYPVYGTPNLPKPMPTREQIDFEGALNGMGLEIGYTDNLIDPFFMQIQGSGIVEFIETGEQYTFGYAGSNGHGYYSIGRYMVEQGYLSASEVSLRSIQDWLRANPSRIREVLSLNKSYVFFKKSKRLPTGSIGQPVTAYCSVAVDPNFIPYGSSVLINRPILNARGDLMGHTPSIFFAQDKGGAIKGAGRVDIYMGIGKAAEQASSALKHYGALWLLLP